MSQNDNYNPLLQNSDITNRQNKQPSKNYQSVQDSLIEQEYLMDITSYIKPIDFEDNPKYRKLELSSGQKASISAMIANAPRIAGAGMLNAAVSSADVTYYVMKLPKGLSGSLMKFKDGSGFGNTLRGADGRFVKQMALNPMELTKQAQAQMQAAAVAASAFAVMSVVTSQYYLKQINDKMDHIRLGVDKILEFLYGDKKAELTAEVSFVKYAMHNFASIMEQECQRVATIVSIQQAKKVAMKDVEFYISDLESTLNDNIGITEKVDKALQIEQSMTLALQLCVMSTILEVDYAQNYDKGYIQYLEDDVSLFIDKTEKMVIGLFNKLQMMVSNANTKLWNQFDKDRLLQNVAQILDKFRNGGESELTRTLKNGLRAAEEPVTYYISKGGEVYIKAAS